MALLRGIDTRGGARDARRARRSTPAPISRRPASASCRSGMPQKNRDGTPMRIAAAAAARDRPRPLCRRSGRARRGRDRGAGARRRRGGVRSTSRPLPAVTTPAEAVAPGAPHDPRRRRPATSALDCHYGDSAAVAAAFARAAHVTKLRIRNSRVVVCPMEPRSALADYDAASGRYTLRVGCQGVFGLRNALRTRAERAGREDARADRQCRRLVRHEGRRLSGIFPRCCSPRALLGPAGEMDR